MQFLDSYKVALERPDEPLGQKGDAFPHSFGLAHRDLTVTEVDVFDAQAQAFEQAQAAAVKQMDHEPVIPFDLGEHGPRLSPGADDGILAGRFTCSTLSMKSSLRSSTCW